MALDLEADDPDPPLGRVIRAEGWRVVTRAAWGTAGERQPGRVSTSPRVGQLLTAPDTRD